MKENNCKDIILFFKSLNGYHTGKGHDPFQRPWDAGWRIRCNHALKGALNSNNYDV